MKLLTIFSAPKPFEDPHITTIQRNAIQSWTWLGKGVEVILMGNDAGVAEVAKEFDVLHLPKVECNEKGVPYIGDMFRLARQHSSAPLLMVVNADIILFHDLLDAAHHARRQFEAFVLAGQRWDMDMKEPLDFTHGWRESLRLEVSLRGKLHKPAGSDYFIFPRQVYQEVPNFTIGRAGWDNWMIYQAVTQPWMAIDATADITILHQNHDYSHLPNGEIHYRHPESERNVELGGGNKKMYYLWDLPHFMVDGIVERRPLSWLRVVRFIERLVQPEEENKSMRYRVYWKLRKLRKRLDES